MIKSITVHNRFHMDLVSNNMRKIESDNWHLISIACPDWEEGQNHALINEKTTGILRAQGCGKILPLQFDDLRDDMKLSFIPVLFSTEQARQVVEFIDEMHKEKEEVDFIVHCDAGISRSGAVAKFVSDYLKIPFHDPYILPNTYVLRKLWEIIDEKNAKKNNVVI